MIEARLRRVREALGALGLDAYISLSSPANTYLTGFWGSTSAVLVTGDEALFLCDFRYTEQAKSQVSHYAIEEVAGAGEVVKRLGERLTAYSVKAVGFDPAVMTVQQLSSVEAAFSGELRAAPNLVGKLRSVKSTDEIARLRTASELAEGILLQVAWRLEEGVTERALATQIEHLFRERGASGASFAPIVLFGARSSLPHGTPGDTPVKKGDVVLIDMGCLLGGYCSDLTRTFVFGTIPGAWFEKIYAVTLSAQLAALASIRPGVSCGDVDAVARDIIRDAGFGDHFGHGLGHGIGLEIHEEPRFSKESKTILEAGMVITVEPGIYLPGRGGVRIEDAVLVTDSGHERLTTSSKQLQVLGV